MLAIHHVSVVVTDLEKSLLFYKEVFALAEIPRPNFPTRGAWLAVGDLQLHLIVNPEGTFRGNNAIDLADGHFAFRTNDFEGVVVRLATLGFSEHLPKDDPKGLLVVRSGAAGFPQLYLCDPDLNVIEINGA